MTLSTAVRQLVLLAALATLSTATPDLADKLSAINKQLGMGLPTIPADLALPPIATAVLSAVPSVKIEAAAASASASSSSSTHHKKKLAKTTSKQHSSSTKKHHKYKSTATSSSSSSSSHAHAKVASSSAPSPTAARMSKMSRRSKDKASREDPASVYTSIQDAIAQHQEGSAASTAAAAAAAAVEARVDEETEWEGLPKNVKLALISSQAGQRMERRKKTIQ